MNTLNGYRAFCVLASTLALVVGLFTGSHRTTEAPVESAALAASAPMNVAEAQQTTAVLTNAIVAAVVSISNTTPPGASADDIAAGSAAVSALLPKGRKPFALIDATGSPLDPKNHARGSFETNGLASLVAGAPIVEQAGANRLRTLVPLTSDMHPNCATCHTNYALLPPGTVVGAASFRIKF